MEGLPSSQESNGDVVRWDKNSYEEILKVFNGLKEGDVLVSRSGTKRKLLGHSDGIYTFEKKDISSEIVAVESLPEMAVFDSFRGSLDCVEKTDKEAEKSHKEIIAKLRELKEGDVLRSKSGTYRIFIGREGNVYKFERHGTDGVKSIQSIAEELLINNFSAVTGVERDI